MLVYLHYNAVAFELALISFSLNVFEELEQRVGGVGHNEGGVDLESGTRQPAKALGMRVETVRRRRRRSVAVQHHVVATELDGRFETT